MPHLTSIPDLTGTLALVTGASDGIGRVISTSLARAGAEVLIPVRSEAKGRKAVEQLEAEVPGAQVRLMKLDLASLDSVAELTQSLLAQARPINLLINNAGVMTPPERQETHDGFELQFGTNHLGHFALTIGLLPLLQEGNARVTHQTSIAARQASINWADLNWRTGYDEMGAYGQSKLAQALFARQLDASSRSLGWGISSNLSHPGVSPTNLLAAQPGLGRAHETGGRRMIGYLSKIGVAGTVQSAAQPALMAATDPGAAGDQFFGPRHVIGGRATEQKLWAPMLKMDDAARLWDESMELIGPRFRL